MNGWKYRGTIGPGELDVSGDSGHNDYLVMPDLTNDAARRTDCECSECGHYYGLHYENCPTRCEERVAIMSALIGNPSLAGVTVVETEAQRMFRIQAEAMKAGGAWSYNEAYDAKAHGARLYEQAARDCDQVCELLAVEEAKAEMEEWRLRNGEWLGYVTDSDGAGEQEQLNRDALEVERVQHEAWLRGLAPPTPGETLGDFAQRAGIDSWYVHSIGGRVHLQWLYDKLAKGEVVGG